MVGRARKARAGARRNGLVAGADQPLIALPGRANGKDTVEYFVDEAAAEAAITDDDIRAALSAIGAWADLDWDEVEAELYRIGHETPPSPPIEL